MGRSASEDLDWDLHVTVDRVIAAMCYRQWARHQLGARSRRMCVRACWCFWGVAEMPAPRAVFRSVRDDATVVSPRVSLMSRCQRARTHAVYTLCTRCAPHSTGHISHAAGARAVVLRDAALRCRRSIGFLATLHPRTSQPYLGVYGMPAPSVSGVDRRRALERERGARVFRTTTLQS